MPCVVVDLGTATKFLVLDKDGNFLGGPIMPGVNISLEALARSAALLPRIELGRIDHIIGKNSVDCMQAGILYGTAGMVDGVLDRIQEELGQEVTAVMTGGIARSIQPFCKRAVAYDENLLLYGLWELYKKNTRPRS